MITSKRRFLIRNLMDADSDREAVMLKWWILSRLLKGEMTADQIYKESECGDQAMYLALHRLVKSKFVEGQSPYDDDNDMTHKRWRYRLSDTAAARRLANIAVIKARHWDPNKWEVNTVLPRETVNAPN
jgi:DNA-binding PadR family transcriptional regulator